MVRYFYLIKTQNKQNERKIFFEKLLVTTPENLHIKKDSNWKEVNQI